ncbi:MAG: indole-3-glycerol phosphate synthase TrpC [Chloroflexota bacterium]|nr:MAG: indole-3-glycerol phosphate synthase TrpC [Chloroflexota bacterium]
MTTYLDRIVADKRDELRERRVEMPLARLEEMAEVAPPPLPFAATLRGRGVRIIAEIKRASPSKGALNLALDPPQLALQYARHGAAAISVLTESRYFKGSIEFLPAIGEALRAAAARVPLLRKDFIFDSYQVVEARAYGADALLLIAAILTDAELHELGALARQLGMDCLVEVHDRAEMERVLAAGATVIGINNRDLRTFAVDLATTLELCSFVPPVATVVSESGIRTAADLVLLHQHGVQAALIGETLVTASDATAVLRELVQACW